MNELMIPLCQRSTKKSDPCDVGWNHQRTSSRAHFSRPRLYSRRQGSQTASEISSTKKSEPEDTGSCDAFENS